MALAHPLIILFCLFFGKWQVYHHFLLFFFPPHKFFSFLFFHMVPDAPSLFYIIFFFLFAFGHSYTTTIKKIIISFFFFILFLFLFLSFFFLGLVHMHPLCRPPFIPRLISSSFSLHGALLCCDALVRTPPFIYIYIWCLCKAGFVGENPGRVREKTKELRGTWCWSRRSQASTATEHSHRAQPTDSLDSLIPWAPSKTTLLHAAVLVFPLCPKRASSTSNHRNRHSRALRLQLASPPSPYSHTKSASAQPDRIYSKSCPRDTTAAQLKRDQTQSKPQLSSTTAASQR